MSNEAGALVIPVEVNASGVSAGIESAKRSLLSLGDSVKDVNEKAIASTNRYIKHLETQNATLGMSERQAMLYKLQVKGATEEQLKQVDALLKVQEAAKRLAPELNNAGMSAKQLAFAMRGIPAQFTDIVVSLQSGQKPLTVLMQQGGQLKDMFGGVGNALRAMGSYVLSLVNPFTVAAAALGLFAYAAYKGQKESEEFRKSIILTGQSSGVTASQLVSMSAHIAASTQFTHGAAAEALNQFAASGTASSATIQKFASVALRLEKEAGIAVKDTVNQFAELGKDPVAASAKLNETTHYLTASVYEQIKSLEEQGKAVEAARLAQETYANAMDARAKDISQNLGFLETAWRGVTAGAKGAWDAMLGIGREDSAEQKIATLRMRLQANGLGGYRNQALSKEQAEATYRPQLEALEKVKQFNDQIAQQAERKAKAEAAGIKWSQDGEQYKSREAKLQEAITKAKNEGVLAGKSEKEIAERIRDIKQKSYGENHGDQIAKARLGLDLAKIKAQLETEVNAWNNAQKLLEASHAAGLVSDKDYFAAKLHMMQGAAAAEQKGLQDEIARAEKIKFTGKERVQKQLENEKLLIELRHKLAASSANAATHEALHAVQVDTAQRKIARAYVDAKTAADAYIKTLERQYARELEGIGLGAYQRKIDQDKAAFDDKRITKENELAAKKRNDAGYTQEQYAKDLALARETWEREVALYDSKTERLLAANTRWENGYRDAVSNMLAESRNVAKQTEALFTTAFHNVSSGIGNSFAEALISGKSLQKGLVDTAKNTAKQMIATYLQNKVQEFLAEKAAAAQKALINKGVLADKIATDQAGAASGMEAKAEETTTNVGMSAVEGAANAFKAMAGIPYVGPILAVAAAAMAMKFVMGLLGGGGSGGDSTSTQTVVNRNPYPTNTAVPVSGTRALGGPVDAGKLYEINERGPEIITAGNRDYLMMGAKGGYVTPNRQLTGSDMSGLATDPVTNIHVTVMKNPNGNFELTPNELGKLLIRGKRDNVKGFENV